MPTAILAAGASTTTLDAGTLEALDTFSRWSDQPHLALAVPHGQCLLWGYPDALIPLTVVGCALARPDGLMQQGAFTALRRDA
ncbi:MAG: hypothetical protein WBA57_02740 [Elainellaceae cyanobacterium]